jgi:hypothetical protein
MPAEIQAALNELHERLTRLERIHTKTSRGRTNQGGAARYLGRSREYLRTLHLRGEGPRRGADGSYSFDELDNWAEQNIP